MSGGGRIVIGTVDRATRDDVLEHAKLVQAVTSKLGQYGLPLRAGAFGLTTVVTGLAVTGHPMIVPPTIVAVLVAMGLDAYFLWQRRLFRRLYDAVIGGGVPWLRMDLAPYRAGCRYWSAAFSATVLAQYMPLVLVLAVAGVT